MSVQCVSDGVLDNSLEHEESAQVTEISDHQSEYDEYRGIVDL